MATLSDLLGGNFQGFSGYSGMSGYSGASGYSGYSGTSGYSGISGYSGVGVKEQNYWDPIPTVQGTTLFSLASNNQALERITNDSPINAYEFKNFVSISFNTARIDQTLTTASRSALYEQFVNFYVGLYTQGTGTQYTNLYSSATYSSQFKVQSSITGTNNNTNNISLRITYPGTNGASATGSGTYSTSGTRFTLQTSQLSDFTGLVHIPLTISKLIDPNEDGVFINIWAVSGTAFSAGTSTSRWISMTSNWIDMSQFGITNFNNAFNPLGATDLSPFKPGVGRFSHTVSNNFASVIPMSAISSTASLQQPYYQLMNSNLTAY
jgi:hypothetical protein